MNGFDQYGSPGSAPHAAGFGGGLGNAFGGATQSVLMDIGKQNLEQYIKVGEQSFLTNYLPFVKDLRQYFRVDHQYVKRKTALLFAPFLQKRIARGSALAEGATFVGGPSGGGHGSAVNASFSPKPSSIRSVSSTINGVSAGFNFGDDFNGAPSNNTNNFHPNFHQGSGSPAPPQVIGGLNTLVSPSSPGLNPTAQVSSPAAGGFKMPLPIDDVLAPDLYIPSMAVLTYVALCGFIRGLTDNSLQPEFLAGMLWSLILWELFEVFVVMVASKILMTPLVVLDTLALAGYKHIGVCLLLLFREIFGLQGSYIYLVPLLYVASCSVWFAYNQAKMFIARRGDGTVHVRSLPLLYSWAGAQAFFVFWFAMKPF